MITFNTMTVDGQGSEYAVGIEHYPDNTMKIVMPSISAIRGACGTDGNTAPLLSDIIEYAEGGCMADARTVVTFNWRYENDAELIALAYAKRHLDKYFVRFNLLLQYVPNARMDRVEDDEDVFTLKYFSEMINALKFDGVWVLDPHSTVTEALIDNIHVVSNSWLVNAAMAEIYSQMSRDGIYGGMYFFPDEGALKRYSGLFKGAVPSDETLRDAGLDFKWTCGFGIKRRDWKTGKIQSLDVQCEDIPDGGFCAVIIDDICSRGGTFLHAAEALKAKGATRVYLIVTHCENSIFSGEFIKSGLVDHIYTSGNDLLDLTKLGNDPEGRRMSGLFTLIRIYPFVH